MNINKSIKRIAMTILGTLIILLLASGANANLIVNGDFEAGDTGFYTDYERLPLYLGEGRYNISSNPQLENGYFASYGDHTTGSGLMMVVNGAIVSNKIVWMETVDISPNTNYMFSVWVANCDGNPPAQLDFLVNSESVGTLTVPSTTGNWQQFIGLWNSGESTSAAISIIDRSTAQLGNDFTIDDLYFEKMSDPVYAPSMGNLGFVALSLSLVFASVLKVRNKNK